MYYPTYFSPEELIHPFLLEKWGEINCMRRMNSNLLIDADLIREQWNDIIYCNLNPIFGRGLRIPDSNSLSSHMMGDALDLVPGNGEYRKFWNFVKDMALDHMFVAINVMEDFAFTPTWCHIAHMNIEENLLIIKP